jgi:hypothetical protein
VSAREPENLELVAEIADNGRVTATGVLAVRARQLGLELVVPAEWWRNPTGALELEELGDG